MTLQVFGQVSLTRNPNDFIPPGFVLYEKIKGDLNKDGIEDCILIIKGTEKHKLVDDHYRGQLDLNRRGIIVLLNKKDHYELKLKNSDCFSSENEDGGVYYAPELHVEIKNNQLIISYAHGRYGYWKYVFRYGNADFELIGYDISEHNGPQIISETSINFLSKQKQKKNYTDDNHGEDNARYIERWSKIKIHELLKLSEIKDIEELNMNEY